LGFPYSLKPTQLRYFVLKRFGRSRDFDIFYNRFALTGQPILLDRLQEFVDECTKGCEKERDRNVGHFMASCIAMQQGHATRTKAQQLVKDNRENQS
jgi:hypothetical protein